MKEGVVGVLVAELGEDVGVAVLDADPGFVATEEGGVGHEAVVGVGEAEEGVFEGIVLGPALGAREALFDAFEGEFLGDGDWEWAFGVDQPVGGGVVGEGVLGGALGGVSVEFG